MYRAQTAEGLPGLIEGTQPFTSGELFVVNTLHAYLRRDSNPPLLVNNEEDLAIQNDKPFFDAVAQASVPADVLTQLKTGEVTHDDIARKMRIGVAITRKEKAFMFTERLITATLATDDCRALGRIARGEPFVPVLRDDTEANVQHRVGDYVANLLQAGRDTRDPGRQTRILRSASMDRLTQTTLAKFHDDDSAQRVLTNLAGMNSRKKVKHYVDQLGNVTGGFKPSRSTKATKQLLNGFLERRPQVYSKKLDIITLIEEKRAQMHSAA